MSGILKVFFSLTWSCQDGCNYKHVSLTYGFGWSMFCFTLLTLSLFTAAVRFDRKNPGVTASSAFLSSAAFPPCPSCCQTGSMPNKEFRSGQATEESTMVGTVWDCCFLAESLGTYQLYDKNSQTFQDTLASAVNVHCFASSNPSQTI